MTPAVRNTAVVLMAFLIGACVQVGHIQDTVPIRAMGFAGSYKAVAQCVHRRLGGKVQEDPFGESYIVYDSVKGQQSEGLTHYSITVRKIGPDEGRAEWRIIKPTTGAGPASIRGSVPPLTAEAVKTFWGPVEDCTAQAKAS